MTIPAVSPLLFFVQVLLLIALGLVVMLAVSGFSPRGTRSRASELLEPVLDRERYVASGLGWSLNVWLTIRLGAFALGLAVGTLIGTPVVILGLGVVGLFGVPWWLTARAAQRKLEMDRALVPFMFNLINLLSQGQQTLNHALKDLAQNPHPRLAYALAPLRTADSVSDALVEVARRGMSPMLERVCVDLMLSLDQTPEAFVEQATKILIPQYDQDLEIQARNHAALAGGRQNGLIVIMVMALAFVVVMRVDTLRAAYAGFVGQVMLVIDGVMVMGILAVLGMMTPKTPWVRWNVAAVREQMRRRYA
jgi:Flp pilus assembly protein TadB